MISLLIVALSMNILVAQGSSTVGQKLGKEKVESVIDRVLTKSKEEYSATYRLTQGSLESLEARGLSEAYSEKLEGLKDTEIRGKEKFMGAVRERIGRDQTGEYQSAILKSAEVLIIIEDEFVPHIREMILKVKAPSSKHTEDWLEAGFSRFMQDYIAYLLKVNKSNSIVVSSKHLTEFLKGQKKKCGEIPCSVPPCCGDVCDPCKN